MDETPYCRFDENVETFARSVQAWLSREPIANNVLATVLASRANRTVDPEPDALWIRILAGGELIGVAIQTPPRGLLLPSLPHRAVDVLAEELRKVRPRLAGANGPKETADRFASLWSVRTGCVARAEMSVRMYQLGDDVVHPSGVPGTARVATLTDRELLAKWTQAFSAEAIADRGRFGEYLLTIQRQLERGRPYLLWEVDGEPVSMAMESQPANGVIRIQLVYTPPGHRGRGYASALVARLSEEIQSRNDITACVLSTDLANPTSNRIYRRIGYRKLRDLVNYVFEY